MNFISGSWIIGRLSGELRAGGLFACQQGSLQINTPLEQNWNMRRAKNPGLLRVRSPPEVFFAGVTELEYVPALEAGF